MARWTLRVTNLAACSTLPSTLGLRVLLLLALKRFTKLALRFFCGFTLCVIW